MTKKTETNSNIVITGIAPRKLGSKGDSLGLSLPKDICEKYKLKPGAIVQIKELEVIYNVVSWFGAHNPFEQRDGKQLVADFN